MLTPQDYVSYAGYVGTSLVLISFLFNDIVKLRLVNIVGQLLALCYTVWLGAWPAAMLNIGVALINAAFLLRFFWVRRRNRAEIKASLDE